jgi:hypothetical protein
VPGRLWAYGTGGVVFESLYAITDDGRTRYSTVSFTTGMDDGESDSVHYSLQESYLQATGGRMGKKIFEGVNLRALLDNEGDLQIEVYGRDQRSFWRKESGGARLADFTVLRRHLVASVLAPSDAREKFARECGLSSVVPDPWFGIGMGLNQQGELVVGGLGDGACLNAGPQRYKELRLETGRAAPQGRSQRERSQGMPEASSEWDRVRYHANGFGEPPPSTRSILWVKDLNGQSKPLLPYSY